MDKLQKRLQKRNLSLKSSLFFKNEQNKTAVGPFSLCVVEVTTWWLFRLFHCRWLMCLRKRSFMQHCPYVRFPWAGEVTQYKLLYLSNPDHKLSLLTATKPGSNHWGHVTNSDQRMYRQRERKWGSWRWCHERKNWRSDIEKKKPIWARTEKQMRPHEAT